MGGFSTNLTEQDDKLFTSQAKQGVYATNARVDQVDQRSQCAVASKMTKLVIDCFEVINVDEHHGR